MKETPTNLLSFNYRSLSIKEYQKKTDFICEAANNEFAGVHMIIVDGGADFLTNVNDEESSYLMVEYFTHLSIRYDCPVVVVVHLNPGSDKERGHFGSQMQRKCYAFIGIKKEGEISCATTKLTRKAGDLPPIYYKYSHDMGYHVEVDAPESREVRKGKENLNRVVALAPKVLKEPRGYRFSELKKDIMIEGGVADGTAKNHIKTLLALDIITKSCDGLYRLNQGKGNLGQFGASLP